MKSTFLSTSVFGRVDTQLYSHLGLIKRDRGLDIETLVVDCVDGHLLCCLARRVKSIVGYETDEVYVNGGRKILPVIHPRTNEQVNIKRTIYGVNDRINMEFLENATVFNQNFYENKIERKYDFVVANRSLERTVHKDIPMAKKIKKLMSSVKKDGYLLINYLFAKDENDYIKYPVNSYARGNEIENFFDFDEWSLVSRGANFNLKEMPHVGNLEEHTIKIGYLLYKKKPTEFKKERMKRVEKDFNINVK